jgi:DNA polymerase-3 subunit gamma/tau
MDVIEMDAASNNGIDDIRDIRDEVVYTPSELKYKVYIIDEVHMLSINAFNGLLKTLEEPPSYVVFILATTEMHKLPTTIISRCQRFDFRKMSVDNIITRLKFIAEHENVSVTDDAAAESASQCNRAVKPGVLNGYGSSSASEDTACVVTLGV